MGVRLEGGWFEGVEWRGWGLCIYNTIRRNTY